MSVLRGVLGVLLAALAAVALLLLFVLVSSFFGDGSDPHGYARIFTVVVLVVLLPVGGLLWWLFVVAGRKARGE